MANVVNIVLTKLSTSWMAIVVQRQYRAILCLRPKKFSFTSMLVILRQYKNIVCVICNWNVIYPPNNTWNVIYPPNNCCLCKVVGMSESVHENKVPIAKFVCQFWLYYANIRLLYVSYVPNKLYLYQITLQSNLLCKVQYSAESVHDL